MKPADFENQLTLYSETDVNGVIIFVNDSFCQVSKYTRKELVGSAHNIIRHPDMPKELFKHLWDTLRKGHVFRGIMKNLAKDGSHYWVQATIVPVRDSTESVNYVCVHHLVSDDRLAEELFRIQRQNLKMNFM